MTVPDVIVFPEDSGKGVNADLASKIRVCRVFTERKLSFSASTSALDISNGAPEGHTLEAGRDDVLADSAGGTRHLATTPALASGRAHSRLADLALGLGLVGR